MRLYAFGGNTAATRRVLGVWELAEAGRERILGSIVGVERESDVVFGVGLTGGSPFLILRIHQDAGPPRWYPYTLLLDPGEDLWKTFEWNGAALASALLAARTSPHPTAQKLWVQPEELQIPELEEWLSGLRPPKYPTLLQSGELELLLVGSLACAKAVIVPSAESGFPAPPSPEEVAAAIHGVALDFRIAGGFLFGGSKDQGDYYGARLVVSDSPTDNGLAPSELRAIRQRGTETQHAWITLKQRSPDLFKQVSRVPVWASARSNASIFEILQLVAPPDPEHLDLDQALARLATIARDQDALSRALVSSILLAIQRQQRTLNSSETVSVVTAAMEGQGVFQSEVWSFLDFEAVTQLLLPRGFPPSVFPDSWNLPRTMVLKLLNHFAHDVAPTSAARAEAVCAYWERAEELKRDSGIAAGDTEGAVALKELLEAFLSYSLDQREPLVGWFSALQRHETLEPLRASLRQAAEHRWQEQSLPSWRLDALLFCPQKSVLEGDVDTFARVALSASALDPARSFIEKLSDPHHRRALSFRLKREIALNSVASTAESAWHNFACLVRLVEGDSCTRPRASEEELWILREELIQAIESATPNMDRAPLLADIERFIGPLDANAVAALGKLRPLFDAQSSVISWLEGWRGAETAVFERELLRVVAFAPSSPEVNEYVADHVHEVSVESARDFILESITYNTLSQKDMLEVMAGLIDFPNVRNVVRDAFSMALVSSCADSFDSELLRTVRAQNGTFVDEVLPLRLDAEDQLGRLLLRTSTEDDFRSLRTQLCRRIRTKNPSQSDRLVFRTLQSREFPRLLDEIVLRCFRGSAVDYQLAITKILTS